MLLHDDLYGFMTARPHGINLECPAHLLLGTTTIVSFEKLSYVVNVIIRILVDLVLDLVAKDLLLL